MTPAGDAVRVSVAVALDPAEAFELFTRETDLWWRRGLRFRAGGRSPGALHFEPGLGGRLFEEYDAGQGRQLVEFGRITEWDPPNRLGFEWRGVNFAPAEKTLVEVQFEPAPGGTRVTVVHSGWASLRPDHPVRHGAEVPAFVRTMGLWWGDLLSSFRECGARPR